jgi:hypothetical protein
MAKMCFGRAGDAYWERRSKASGLRATAAHKRHSNPEAANKILREAAKIFEAIGMADSAAQCFSELGEYERAGTHLILTLINYNVPSLTKIMVLQFFYCIDIIFMEHKHHPQNSISLN